MKLDQVGFSYVMLGFQDLRIMRRCKCEDHCDGHEDIECDEKVDGITYEVHWHDKIFPLILDTNQQAMIAAMAAQWAAK